MERKNKNQKNDVTLGEAAVGLVAFSVVGGVILNVAAAGAAAIVVITDEFKRRG